MQPLLSNPLDVELDPETQAVVDEVCGALADVAADPWADQPNYGHLRFGKKWDIALRSTGDHVCRQRILAAVEQIIRSDSEVVVTVGGVLYPREQIRQCHGRESYVVDSQTGEMRRMIEWPTGTYAGGNPSYEKPEAA
jgi:hypothetical protein